MRRWLVPWLVLSLCSPVYGQEAQTSQKEEEKSDVSEILDNMGYPELQVVPRASERLLMEAKYEARNWAIMHWPIQIAGLSSLWIGLTSKANQRENLKPSQKDDAKTLATITTTVGAAWLIGGVILGSQRPYRAGLASLGRAQPRDQRATLLRERLAEEALEQPARTMSILQNFAFATTFTVNALSILPADDKGKIYAGVATVLSFMPLLFEDRTVSVYRKHREYKKKIYAPLKTGSFHYDPETKTITPMVQIAWNF